MKALDPSLLLQSRIDLSSSEMYDLDSTEWQHTHQTSKIRVFVMSTLKLVANCSVNFPQFNQIFRKTLRCLAVGSCSSPLTLVYASQISS
jgi:hypothetical protein